MDTCGQLPHFELIPGMPLSYTMMTVASTTSSFWKLCLMKSPGALMYTPCMHACKRDDGPTAP